MKVDRISNLPDPILHLILSQIPTTEEVIRTSILSRRWRYVWTSVPSIDIHYTRKLNPSQEFDSNGFREFVDWVLLNKFLNLDSFRLRCDNFYNMLTITEWIDAAVMRKVKLLDLTFCLNEEPEDVELPHSLLTCDSLEVLKLCLLKWTLSLPKFTGFPALRVLELNKVDLDDGDYNVVKYFVESCPSLEDLSLIDCNGWSLVISSPKLKNLRIETPLYRYDSLEICCPKLEFLMLKDYVSREFLFETLYSLKKAVIHAIDLYKVNLDFFSRISRVEYLSICLQSINEFFDPEGHAPISLPNLKTLELTFDSINMDELIPFLKCVPDLESLHLIIVKYGYHGFNELNLEEAETINILTRCLKRVEFLEFDEGKPKLAIARAFLEHGNALEEMVFSWDNEARFHERSMETMNEISNFYKASSIVKLTATIINPTQANYGIRN